MTDKQAKILERLDEMEKASLAESEEIVKGFHSINSTIGNLMVTVEELRKAVLEYKKPVVVEADKEDVKIIWTKYRKPWDGYTEWTRNDQLARRLSERIQSSGGKLVKGIWEYRFSGEEDQFIQRRRVR